jgi:hypothetical protein
MFSIEMLSAGRGDCLWVEYGEPGAVRRVLIDGGVPATARQLRERIEALPVAERRFELLVVTHIDLDHIGGVLELLRHPPEGLSFGDVWFNGFHHLPEDPGVLGGKQGEGLAFRLTHGNHPWNMKFGGAAVARAEPDALPRIELDGGMRITLLTPTPDRLAELRPVWKKEIEKLGLTPGQAGEALEKMKDPGLLGDERPDVDKLAASTFKGDDSEANGSSIAFVAAYGGKRCLFAGDAFAPDLAAGLDLLAMEEGDSRVALDALKLSHHGGRKNTSAQLLKAVACRDYLFSTDGSYYQHPHDESVARVVVHGAHRGKPRLWFNHRPEKTTDWAARPPFDPARYEPRYPDGEPGMRVDL